MSSAARPVVNRPTKPQRSTIDRRPAWESISRGVAVFWGLFLLLQVFLWGDSYTVWWLGELPFPSTAQRGRAHCSEFCCWFTPSPNENPKLYVVSPGP